MKNKRLMLIIISIVITGCVPLFIHTIKQADTNIESQQLKDEEGDGIITKNDWLSYENLAGKLMDIKEKAHGKVDVRSIGKSHQDRDIWSVRVGIGNKVLLIISEIHGNEKSGTEAILQLITNLVTSEEPNYKSVYDNTTIVAVPILNPDGSILEQRSNKLSWEDAVAQYPELEDIKPPSYYRKNEGGFDINRDFNPDLYYELEPNDFPWTGSDPGLFLTNESKALRDLYLDLKKEFGKVEAFVDIHHMGHKKIEGTDTKVEIAIDYPPLGPDNNKKYVENYPDYDVDISKQFALAAALGAKEVSNEGVARYIHPKVRDKPGQVRSAFALNGTGSVLFELPGKVPKYGRDEKQINLVETSIMGIATRMADNTVYDLNPGDFYNLPKYWRDSPEPSPENTYQTDFSHFEPGTYPNDWEHWWLGEIGEWQVEENPSRLVHVSGSGRRALTVGEIGSVYGDSEVYAIVRGENVQDTLFQIGIHRSGFSGNENSIIVDARINNAKSKANRIRLLEWRGGSTKVLGAKRLPFHVKEKEWYGVVIQRSGESIKAKMWPVFEDEPDWQIQKTNRNIYGGAIGISHFSPGTINEYAYFSVGVGGESAPRPGTGVINELNSGSKAKK